MPFQRILRVHIKGSSLLGLSLDSLHSEKIDVEGLKQWIDRFANSIVWEFNFEGAEESHRKTFYELFIFDLVSFCIAVAQVGHEISDDAYDAIIDLVSSDYLTSKEDLNAVWEIALSEGWQYFPPMSFCMLVTQLGKGSRFDVNTAAQVAYFYEQVAKYIYSIDDSQSLENEENLNAYISSFFKYVEVASSRDFDVVEEAMIVDILQDWEELTNEEKEAYEKSLCGAWMPTGGDAITKGGFRELVIRSDGTGYLERRKHFRTTQEPITWESQDRTGPLSLVVSIPTLGAYINFLKAGDRMLIGSVFANNSKLNQTMINYERAL